MRDRGASSRGRTFPHRNMIHAVRRYCLANERHFEALRLAVGLAGRRFRVGPGRGDGAAWRKWSRQEHAGEDTRWPRARRRRAPSKSKVNRSVCVRRVIRCRRASPMSRRSSASSALCRSRRTFVSAGASKRWSGPEPGWPIRSNRSSPSSAWNRLIRPSRRAACR